MTRSENRNTGRALGAEIFARLSESGAEAVDPSILQSADTLLDLYGEDIRARAYITADPLRGEQMLRPDFTVPIVQRHMDRKEGIERYTYFGEVFRKQEHDPTRATEYLQVGYEVFGDVPRAKADAEVFATILTQLRGFPLHAVTGDIGILRAAVLGLNTTDRRKSALLRHLWRPNRFRQLLDRFGGISAMPETRSALLAQDDPMAGIPASLIGLRTPAEIAERINALSEDARTAPISSEEIALLDTLLGLKETSVAALEKLRTLAAEFPSLVPGVQNMSARLDALSRHDIDISTLRFEGGYGRTSMEYYDGFVFGFMSANAPELPPVATGGRYDALTQVLGNGVGVPAVGGVIRPEILAGLEGNK